MTPGSTIVVPHELTHLVFDTAVTNPYHFPPRWLNEGLAVYLSEGYDARRPGHGRATRRATATSSRCAGLSASSRPRRGRSPGLRRERVRGRLPHPDPRPGRARGPHPLVRRRARPTTRRSRPRSGMDDDGVRRRPGWPTSVPRRRSRFGPQPAPAGPVPAAWAGDRRRRRDRRRPARPAPRGDRRRRRGPPTPVVDADGRSARPIALIVVVSWASRLIAPSAWRRRRGSAVGRPVTVMARIRAIPSWQITLGAALLGLGLPRRGPAGRRGPARPLHDPGTDAAGRDGHRAAGAAGGAQGAHAGPAERRSRRPSRRARGRRPSSGASTTSSSRPAIAAGLIPLTGTGIVLQLEDSLEPRRRRARTRPTTSSARATCGRSSRSCGPPAPRPSRSTASAITPTTAIIDIGPSMLVNAAYLAAAVPGHGARPGGPVRPSERRPRVRRPHPRPRRGVTASASRSPSPRPSTCRPSPVR